MWHGPFFSASYGDQFMTDKMSSTTNPKFLFKSFLKLTLTTKLNPRCEKGHEKLCQKMAPFYVYHLVWHKTICIKHNGWYNSCQICANCSSLSYYFILKRDEEKSLEKIFHFCLQKSWQKIACFLQTTALKYKLSEALWQTSLLFTHLLLLNLQPLKNNQIQWQSSKCSLEREK